jgi:hypothetical protein
LNIADIETFLKALEPLLNSDLVKIGIPSLVAVLSTYFTVRMSLKSAKTQKDYDKQIAELNNRHDSQKRISEKKDKLIEEILNGLSEIYAAAFDYLPLIASKREEELGKARVEALKIHESRVQQAYQHLKNMRNKHLSRTGSFVLLLNNEEIKIAYGKFIIAVSDIFVRRDVDTELSVEELVDFKSIHTPFQKLCELLSEEYLHGD